MRAAGGDAGCGREFHVTLEFDAVEREIEGQRGLGEDTLEVLHGGRRGKGDGRERRGFLRDGDFVIREVERPSLGHEAAQVDFFIQPGVDDGKIGEPRRQRDHGAVLLDAQIMQLDLLKAGRDLAECRLQARLAGERLAGGPRLHARVERERRDEEKADEEQSRAEEQKPD